MTDVPDDRTPSRIQEFEDALEELVVEAVLDEITVEGAWDVSGGEAGQTPEYTVEIYRVDRSNRAGD